MGNIKIKVQRLNKNSDLSLPNYESNGSSGLDIRADISEAILLTPGQIKLIPTGLAMSIPMGYEAQIRPRSGLALKNGIGVINSPGTIDSDYRGEIAIILINWSDEPFLVNRGDRIAQMIFCNVSHAELLEVNDLEEKTLRGSGGFGHTGVE